MARVTNIILTFDRLEDEEARMGEVNRCDFRPDGLGFCAPVRCMPSVCPKAYNLADPFIGGTANIEVPIYLGAFRNIRIEALLQDLREVSWQYPENVRVYVWERGEGGFRERFHEFGEFEEWKFAEEELEALRSAPVPSIEATRNSESSMPPNGSIFYTKVPKQKKKVSGCCQAEIIQDPNTVGVYENFLMCSKCGKPAGM